MQRKNFMSDCERTADQFNAFQKIWTETFAKLMQSAVLPGQQFVAPEMARQMRGTVFNALGQSWDQFMRSPQFTEAMKQGMDQAINFRKMSNDFMSKVWSELQAPTRDDVEAVAFAVRGIEKRLASLADQVAEIKSAVAAGNTPSASPPAPAARNGGRRRARKTAGARSAVTTKSA